MAENDTQFSGKIRQKGIFNFRDFYNFAYDLLREEGYRIQEKNYTEGIKGDSKKTEIRWIALKKVSDYFRYMIQVDWLVLDMKNVEVQKEGKKVKMNSGDAELRIKGILTKDYEHKWEDNPFFKILRGIYDRYIIRSRVERYEDNVLDETEEFVAQCKSFLAISGKGTRKNI